MLSGTGYGRVVRGTNDVERMTPTADDHKCSQRYCASRYVKREEY
jgi:hypothetical protein